MYTNQEKYQTKVANNYINVADRAFFRGGFLYFSLFIYMFRLAKKAFSRFASISATKHEETDFKTVFSNDHKSINR